MRVLITGAPGFVGRHLIHELTQNGMEVIASGPPGITQIQLAHTSIPCWECDIEKPEDVKDLIQKTRPDAVVHLAALSHVGQAEKDRGSLVAVNVVGTHNLCHALARSGRPVTFLYVSTSLVYGQAGTGSHVFDETSPTRPETPYGCSKLAGEYVVQSYASDSFKPYIVRPFNHIGPGQSTQFVCSGLASKIARAKDGEQIEVGNLKAYRDFTDVRDIVRAYAQIIRQSPDKRLFVLGSGRLVKIQDVLEWFIQRSGKKITAVTSKSLERAIDPPRLGADTSLAQKVLKWTPQIPLETSWGEIYEEALRLISH